MDTGVKIQETEEQRYRAPALEKGLDILELLSRASKPMTVAMITQELGRSTGELFRMLQVLEHRGYIEGAQGSGYRPTGKLFNMGLSHAPVKTLQEVALPVMRTLSDETEQSCHLALRAGGEIVIVARVEAAALLGFSVRLGYRQPLALTVSGAVLYAFQSYEVRERWERDLVDLTEEGLVGLRLHADRVLRQGYDRKRSTVVPGIVDLSAPIMRGDSAAAALTMPFVRKNPLRVSISDAVESVKRAAQTISDMLGSTDVRV